MNKQQQIKELYIDWNELEAYRDLSGQPFDFGTGLIIDDSTQSEDVYWKMQQWNIDNRIYILENYYQYSKNKYNNRLTQYERKFINQNKFKKLYTISWMPVRYDNTTNRYIRCYRGSRSKFLKKLSNKKLRKYKFEFLLKGGGYKKVFDFWWELL